MSEPETKEATGELLIGLCHQPIAKKLIVKIFRAWKLVNGIIGKDDAYVKVALWHKDKLITEVKTDTQNNTQYPIFNKVLFLDLPELDQDGLKNIKLEFIVMDEDIGKDDLIGKLVIGGENCAGRVLEYWNQVIAFPLEEKLGLHPIYKDDIDGNDPDEQANEDDNEIKPFEPFSVEKKTRGDLLLGLCHQPTAKKLIVKVKQARNLVKEDTISQSDPFVKIAMWSKDELITEAKTATHDNIQNPVFNRTVFFDLPELGQDGLKNIKLEFTVMDEDCISQNDLIGRLVMGGDEEVKHWNQVIASPLEEIEVWHPISDETKSIEPSWRKNFKIVWKVKQADGTNGDLLVGFCHQPIAKKLAVKVKQARNLVKSESDKKPNAYIEITLWHKNELIGNPLIAMARTSTQNDTQNPIYNENVFFDLPELGQNGLNNTWVEFTVKDDDDDEVIGKLVIGGEDSAGTALEHWKQIIAFPLSELEVWHPIDNPKPVEKKIPLVEDNAKL